MKIPPLHLVLPLTFFAVGACEVASADLKGSDPLTSDSGNWGELFPNSDRGRLKFRDGHGLIYNAKSDTENRYAYLRWKPAKAREDEDWYAQVTVNLNHSDKAGIGIAIVNVVNRNEGYLVGMLGGEDFGSVRARNLSGGAVQNLGGTLGRGTVRLHYNSRNRMITASWNTRGVWRFLKPFDTSVWNIRKGEAFHIVLIGRQVFTDDDWVGRNSKSSPAASSDGDPFFRNFRCGPVESWMSIENTDSRPLSYPTASLGFGRAAVGGPGKTMTVIIRNQGTAPLTGIRLVKTEDPGGHFEVQQPAATVLKPGGTLPFRLRFDPSKSGSHRALVTVESNDPRRLPQAVRISGIGG